MKNALAVENKQVNSTMKIAVILNPVSGLQTDTESLIRGLLEDSGFDWTITLTTGEGDAFESAQNASANGVDLVLACGGDGTVTEVASGLRGSTTPMSILPAGTGNVMAVELGIPMDIPRVLRALLARQFTLRQVDMALLDQEPFLLRVGVGYEAEISVGASREDKARHGRLAYMVAAWRKLRGFAQTQYRIQVDDKLIVMRGVTCMICNSANVGVPNVSLNAQADVSDGLLDVIVVKSLRLPSILLNAWNVIISVLPIAEQLPPAPNHWQGREITVETTRRQMIAVDGEPYKRGKRVTAQVLPSAVWMAIPQFNGQQFARRDDAARSDN